MEDHKISNGHTGSKNGNKMHAVDGELVQNVVNSVLGSSVPDSATLAAECKIPVGRPYAGIEGMMLGEWTLQVYQYKGQECTALIKGNIANARDQPILTRIHSECLTGNVLGSCRCDCSEQLENSMKIINDVGRGVVLYVTGHEGRGIGLANKVRAYQLQSEQGLDTFTANEQLGFHADSRNYEVPLSVLKALKIDQITLLTNNPHKAASIRHIVHSIMPLTSTVNPHNRAYLNAKITKYGTIIPVITTLPKDTNDSSNSNKINRNNDSNNKSINSSDKINNSSNDNNNNSNGSNNDDNHNYQHKKEMPLTLPSSFSVAGVRIGLVRTMWNDSLVSPLCQGFKEGLAQAGMTINEHTVVEKLVAGSFELPIVAQYLAESGEVDAVVTIGVVIRGDTPHFDYVSENASRGVMEVGLKTGVPVIFGIILTNNVQQAEERCLPPSPLPQSLAITTLIQAAHAQTAKQHKSNKQQK